MENDEWFAGRADGRPVVTVTACSEARTRSALTFDMSGGTKWAKPALGRPLDGGVRPHEGCAAYG